MQTLDFMEADSRMMVTRNQVAGEGASKDVNQKIKFTLGGISSTQLLYNVSYG